jgi:hypothetical protein
VPLAVFHACSSCLSKGGCSSSILFCAVFRILVGEAGIALESLDQKTPVVIF